MLYLYTYILIRDDLVNDLVNLQKFWELRRHLLLTRDAQMVGTQVLPCTIVPRDQVVPKHQLIAESPITMMLFLLYHVKNNLLSFSCAGVQDDPRK